MTNDLRSYFRELLDDASLDQLAQSITEALNDATKEYEENQKRLRHDAFYEELGELASILNETLENYIELYCDKNLKAVPFTVNDVEAILKANIVVTAPVEQHACAPAHTLEKAPVDDEPEPDGLAGDPANAAGEATPHKGKELNVPLNITVNDKPVDLMDEKFWEDALTKLVNLFS